MPLRRVVVSRSKCSTVVERGMPEDTHKYFCAQLGEVTPEVEARLKQWAAAGCEEFSLLRDANHRAKLYFAREPRTVRQMQNILRTFTSRWKLPLGKLKAGWLQPFTAEEYRAAISAASAKEESIPARACAYMGPTRTEDDPGFVLQKKLSQGFDERAHILLEGMRQCQLVC